ncbi:MAG TPA: DivIVA domain-containing protein [Actinocrinis sp.]
MFWFQLVVIVALLAAVGWIAVGGGGHMSEPAPDRPDLALPENGLLDRDHVDRVRFSVGVRGYRMDEVDDVLDRLAHEIDLRERRIAELEGREPDGGEEAGSPAPEYEYTSPATVAAYAEDGESSASATSAGAAETSGSEGGAPGPAAESGADPMG